MSRTTCRRCAATRAPTRASCRASGAARRRRCTAATPTTTASSNVEHWDDLTRRVVVDRVERVPELRFFSDAEAATLVAFCDVVLAQDAEPRIPVLAFVDQKLAEGASTATSTPTCPTTARPGGSSPGDSTRPRERAAPTRSAGARVTRSWRSRGAFAEGTLAGGVWDELNLKHAWAS